MVLVCIRAFGGLKPGQAVQVPDGDKFDTTYFRVAESESPVSEGGDS